MLAIVNNIAVQVPELKLKLPLDTLQSKSFQRELCQCEVVEEGE